MNEYKVTVKTTGTETYYVVAGSEQEALDEWVILAPDEQDITDHEVVSVELEDEDV